MHGIPLMKVQLAIDVHLQMIVMVKELVLFQVGAKEHQDPQKIQIIATMKQ